MINFTKMHGIGNDYVYVNCFKETVTNPEEFSRFISDRHFGIGSDGLILIMPSEIADFKMQMYNADGSEGKMCGNGVRCIAKYVYDNHLTDKTRISLETKGGIKYLTLTIEDGIVSYVEVDMGKAIFTPKEIPVISELDKFIREPVVINGKEFLVTCVSMGNPHAVIFTEGIEQLELEKIGPSFENNPIFPEKVNTEFVEIMDKNIIKMRVWERGSGETLACGTGACASAVAGVLNGYCEIDTPITVQLRGGDLKVTYLSCGTVLMGGPAAKVFDGTIDY